MPTTAISQKSSLKFVKGSHLWKQWFYPKKFETHGNYSVDENATEMLFEDLPEIDEDKHEILSWNLEVLFRN